MNTVKQKAPPKTNPRKILIKKVKTSEVEIEVYAEVLSDKKDHSVTEAETTFKLVKGLSSGNFAEAPGYSWEPKGGQKIIVKINGPVEIKCTVEIQTAYGTNTKPTDRSVYGRGTTPADEKTGNISVGFHESCHQNDYISYLKNKPFPVFSGKIGMTIHQYNQAVDAFLKSFDNYFKDMKKNSYSLTDEVGNKKSFYIAKGPRK
jgi:hypothetical protein